MIDRRAFSATLAAGATTALLGLPSRAHAATNALNAVLVHGAYTDGSSWSAVITRLQAAGMRVIAVQNPLRSFADDVAVTRRVLAMQNGPAVLVGHSYGGSVISEVGGDPNVSSLVYVAARAPDAGEDYAALAKRFPTPPAGAGVIVADGYQQFSETAFLADFASGVDPAAAHALYAVQAPIAASLFASAHTTTAAWRSKPAWYAVSKQDRAMSPALERFLAMRMKATTVEIDSGHLSLVSHPQVVSDLILAAAGRTI